MATHTYDQPALLILGSAHLWSWEASCHVVSPPPVSSSSFPHTRSGAPSSLSLSDQSSIFAPLTFLLGQPGPKASRLGPLGAGWRRRRRTDLDARPFLRRPGRPAVVASVRVRVGTTTSDFHDVNC